MKSSNRSVVVSWCGAVIVTLAGALLVAPSAQALHECGAYHKGKHSRDKDDDSHHKGKGGRAEAKGCRHLDERDFFYGDVRPDAPELAARGEYKVGVRTLDLVNPDQVDILNYSATNTEPRYDRPLTVEVWYPARLKKKEEEITTYDDALGTGPGNPDRPVTPFKFPGRAARDAKPLQGEPPFPLVIVSHGYPGSRVLLSYLTENLASKGYVVAAIDHTESTHADKVGFASTLLNRTLDINFVIREMAVEGSYGFLADLVDVTNVAVIGYSMGGYGALIAAGAGVTGVVEFFVPGGYASILREGSPEYASLLDPRIRAVVLFAPFGGTFGIWSPTGIGGLTVPSLFIVGDQDRTAPYAGVQYLFDNAVNSDRYLLLYEGGIHEVAVNPAPPIAAQNYAEWLHYQEPILDNRKLNNVNQHFITAFLGMHLKGDFLTYQPYLDLQEPISNDSPRTDTGDPNYWKGFPAYSAIGMQLHHRTPAP